MASHILNKTQIHDSYINKLITYQETLFSNLTDKIIYFLLPPIKYYSLFLKKHQQDQQEEPISAGFYILLALLIIALIITSYLAYKERCKRLLHGHEAIKQGLKIQEENQNMDENVLNETKEIQILFKREMMKHEGEVKINNVDPEAVPVDALGDHRTTSDREIEQDLNAAIRAAQAKRNANPNQTNANQRQRRKFVMPKKAPMWRP